MSVEGMWAIYFGDVADRRIVNSGIMVLETGRVFGGDSLLAYKGTYSISDNELSGEAEVWSYNPYQIATSAFGQTGDITGPVSLSGTLAADGKTITGKIWRNSSPGNPLGCELRWISDLP